MSSGVSNPLTPEQSKAQVIDAARDIVSILGIRAVESGVWHASCNDQGDAPFRAAGNVGYPLAPTLQQADAEVASMVKTLRDHGWADDPEFRTHGMTLRKNNVTAVFSLQNSAIPVRRIELYGECRDVTTTKATKGDVEPIPFGS